MISENDSGEVSGGIHAIVTDKEAVVQVALTSVYAIIFSVILFLHYMLLTNFLL